MFLLILTASTVFFCCKGTSKQITVSSDKLKEFFFYKGATDYLEPPVKEIYFGRIKSIKSLYNNFSDEQHGQNFEKFYFNENGIKVRIEGGQTGTIDTILWYRTIEYLNSTKKESSIYKFSNSLMENRINRCKFKSFFKDSNFNWNKFLI